MTSLWADLLVGKSYVPASYQRGRATRPALGQLLCFLHPTWGTGLGAGDSYLPEFQGMVVPGGVPFAVSSSAGSLQQGT